MVHTRWQIVVVSFISGILVGLCLAFSLSGGREEAVWRGTLSARTPQTFEKIPLPGVRRSPGEAFVVEGRGKPTATKAKIPAKTFTSLQHLPQYADRLATSSYTAIEDAYYRRLEGVHLKCILMPHIGLAGDGGWEVCMAAGFKPKKPCLVYSFGINNIWEFDESMARDFGCTVRAFDPSMSVNDHVHKPGPVHFYKIGLGGSDRTLSNGWKLFTFQSLLTRFGETDRIIDLLKIDVEYSEWETFESMLSTGVFKRVKQLIFETHTNDLNNVITSKTDYLRYHQILDSIESLGFRRFYRHENQYGIGPVTRARSRSSDPVMRKSSNLRRTCCHELYYINMRFITDESGVKIV